MYSVLAVHAICTCITPFMQCLCFLIVIGIEKWKVAQVELLAAIDPSRSKS